jgi:hypothetical protein
VSVSHVLQAPIAMGLLEEKQHALVPDNILLLVPPLANHAPLVSTVQQRELVQFLALTVIIQLEIKKVALASLLTVMGSALTVLVKTLIAPPLVIGGLPLLTHIDPIDAQLVQFAIKDQSIPLVLA